MLHCTDCLAHYSEGFNHVCPPWLKMMVTAYNEKNRAPKGSKA